MDNNYKNAECDFNTMEENYINNFILKKINDVNNKLENQSGINENVNIYNSHKKSLNNSYKSVNNEKNEIKKDQNLKSKKLTNLINENNYNLNLEKKGIKNVQSSNCSSSTTTTNNNNNSNNNHLFNDLKKNMNNIFSVCESNYIDESVRISNFNNQEDISNTIYNVESSLEKFNDNLSVRNRSEGNNISNDIYSNMRIVNANYISNDTNNSSSTNNSNKNCNNSKNNVNSLNNLNNNSLKTYDAQKKTKNVNNFANVDVNIVSEKSCSNVKKNCFAINDLNIINNTKNKNYTEYFNYMNENTKSGTKCIVTKDKKLNNPILENKQSINAAFNNHINTGNSYSNDNILQADTSNNECSKSSINLNNNSPNNETDNFFTIAKEDCTNLEQNDQYLNGVNNSVNNKSVNINSDNNDDGNSDNDHIDDSNKCNKNNLLNALHESNDKAFNCDINDYVLLVNKNLKTCDKSNESNIKENKTNSMTTDSTIYTNNGITLNKNTSKEDLDKYQNFNYHENVNMNSFQKDYDEAFNKNVTLNNSKDNILSADVLDKDLDFNVSSQLHKHLDIPKSLHINNNMTFLNMDESLTDWKLQQNYNPLFLKKENSSNNNNNNMNPNSFCSQIHLNETENTENKYSIPIYDMQKSINEKNNFQYSVGNINQYRDDTKKNINSAYHTNNFNKNAKFIINNSSKHINHTDVHNPENTSSVNNTMNNNSEGNILNDENHINGNFNNNTNIIDSNYTNNAFFINDNGFSCLNYKNKHMKNYTNKNNLMYRDQLLCSYSNDKNNSYCEKENNSNDEMLWANNNLLHNTNYKNNNQPISNYNVDNGNYDQFLMFMNNKRMHYDNNSSNDNDFKDGFNDGLNDNGFNYEFKNNFNNGFKNGFNGILNNSSFNGVINGNNKNDFSNEFTKNFDGQQQKNNYALNYSNINNNNKYENDINDDGDDNTNNNNRKNSAKLKKDLNIKNFNIDSLNYRNIKFHNFSYKNDFINNNKPANNPLLKLSSNNIFNNKFNGCEIKPFDNSYVFNPKDKVNNNLINYSKALSKDNSTVNTCYNNQKDESNPNTYSNVNNMNKNSLNCHSILKNSVNNNSCYSNNEKKESHYLSMTNDVLEFNENINLIANNKKKKMNDPFFCFNKKNIINYPLKTDNCNNIHNGLNEGENNNGHVFDSENKCDMYDLNNNIGNNHYSNGNINNIYHKGNEYHLDEYHMYNMNREHNVYDNLDNMCSLHENINNSENNCMYNKTNNIEENNNNLYLMDNNNYMYNDLDNDIYNDMSNLQNSDNMCDGIDNGSNLNDNMEDNGNLVEGDNMCNINNIENNMEFILGDNENLENHSKGNANDDKISELKNIANNLKVKNRLEKELIEIKNMYLKKKQCLILNRLSNKNDDISNYSTFNDESSISDCDDSAIQSNKYIQKFLKDKDKYNDTKISIQRFHLSHTNNFIGKLKIAAQRDISGSFMGPKGIHVKKIKSSLHISVYKSVKDVWFPGFVDSHVFLLKGNIFGILRACQLLYHYVKSKMSSSKCCIYLVAPFECVQKLLADKCKRMAIIKEECGADIRLGNLYVQLHEGFTERLMEIRGNEDSVDCALGKLVTFMQSCFSVQSYDYELLKYPCRSVLNLP